MTDWDELFDDIRGAIVVGLLAIVGVYILLTFAAELAPDAPTWVGGLVIGSLGTMAVGYIYLRVRGEFKGGR